MIHAGAELAHRLEGLICDEWRRLAELSASLWPERGATYLDVAGGVALWLGEDQLVNVATGLAMDGPPEEGDLRAIEDFYSSRGTVPMVATCPFADPSLFMLLGVRGWRLAEFENALALEPDLSSSMRSSPIPSSPLRRPRLRRPPPLSARPRGSLRPPPPSCVLPAWFRDAPAASSFVCASLRTNASSSAASRRVASRTTTNLGRPTSTSVG